MVGGSSEEVAVLQGGGAAIACGEGSADIAREGVKRERGLGRLVSFYGGRHSNNPLPLTPTSYVPIIVSAIQVAASAAVALTSLLVILLPHILSLQPMATSEFAWALATFLSCPDASWLPTGTLHSVVKSLSHLALHLDPIIEEDGLDGDGGGRGRGEEVAVP
jgi:ribosomal RNA-processing protein 12